MVKWQPRGDIDRSFDASLCVFINIYVTKPNNRRDTLFMSLL